MDSWPHDRAETRPGTLARIDRVWEVEVIAEEGKIVLRRPVTARAATLAGSPHRYARRKPFPSERRIAEALRRGLIEGG